MKIKIKRKEIVVEECKSFFAKARGLMFRRNSKPLLFVFKKPTRASIHSFFCKPFQAIWLDNGRIVGEKIIKPFSCCIKPKKPFTHLVEIPLTDDNTIIDFSSEK